jgi:hypothetical protein
LSRTCALARRPGNSTSTDPPVAPINPSAARRDRRYRVIVIVFLTVGEGENAIAVPVQPFA